MSVDAAQSRREAEMNECLGDVIRSYLDDPSTTDVIVNPDGRLYVDQLGRGLHFTGTTISGPDTETIIRLTGFGAKAPVNSASPLLKNATIPGRNERISGCIGAGVTKGPMFAIRVPPKKVVESFPSAPRAESIEHGEYDGDSSFLDSAVKAVRNRRNVCIAGGTGSGKTSLLSMLLKHLEGRRVLLFEDAEELVPPSETFVQFLSIDGVVSSADLLKLSLRLRPDQVINGEIRDADAASVLVELANTGHRGTIFTMHADGADEAQSKLMAWCRKSNVSEYDVYHTIDAIIYCERGSGEIPAITQFIDARGERLKRKCN